MMTLQERLEENFYDDHENCDDSCGKKANYSEMLSEIEKDILELIGEDEAITNVTLTLPDEVKLYLTQNDGSNNEIPRNALRAELRLKLKEYMGGNSA
jgi:hypothetical protein